jgi:hypothetical protein
MASRVNIYEFRVIRENCENKAGSYKLHKVN